MTPIPKISKITRALQMSIARHMALCIPVGGKSRDPPSPPYVSEIKEFYCQVKSASSSCFLGAS